jgi:hypothetical protein
MRFPFPFAPQVGLQMSPAARGWPGVAGFSDSECRPAEDEFLRNMVRRNSPQYFY